VSPRVVALVPARNEADRIGATVRALRGIDAIDEVVVVDDASRDGTACEAAAAGAAVLRIPRRAGKGRAIEGALRRVRGADVWLFADGDLGETAAELGPLVERVSSGAADMAIAVLPPQPGGGFGMVKRASARAIRALSGFDATEPLSGQRALSDEVRAACAPLAGGFGLETALTVDAVRAGFRVEEMALEVTHRPTGRDLRGFAHRGRQGIDILRAVVVRSAGLR
jgi:glycosyltransferase involved in cell wall biosynthesis